MLCVGAAGVVAVSCFCWCCNELDGKWLRRIPTEAKKSAERISVGDDDPGTSVFVLAAISEPRMGARDYLAVLGSPGTCLLQSASHAWSPTAVADAAYFRLGIPGSTHRCGMGPSMPGSLIAASQPAWIARGCDDSSDLVVVLIRRSGYLRVCACCNQRATHGRP